MLGWQTELKNMGLPATRSPEAEADLQRLLSERELEVEADAPVCDIPREGRDRIQAELHEFLDKIRQLNLKKGGDVRAWEGRIVQDAEISSAQRRGLVLLAPRFSGMAIMRFKISDVTESREDEVKEQISRRIWHKMFSIVHSLTGENLPQKIPSKFAALIEDCNERALALYKAHKEDPDYEIEIRPDPAKVLEVYKELLKLELPREAMAREIVGKDGITQMYVDTTRKQEAEIRSLRSGFYTALVVAVFSLLGNCVKTNGFGLLPESQKTQQVPDDRVLRTPNTDSTSGVEKSATPSPKTPDHKKSGAKEKPMPRSEGTSAEWSGGLTPGLGQY